MSDLNKGRVWCGLDLPGSSIYADLLPKLGKARR